MNTVDCNKVTEPYHVDWVIANEAHSRIIFDKSEAYTFVGQLRKAKCTDVRITKRDIPTRYA